MSENNFNTFEVSALKKQLVETIHFLHSKGYAPATSSNYSFRVPNEDTFWISRSGIDKGNFKTEDLMLIDKIGKPLEEPSARSSAETLLHLLIYDDPTVNAILHTHSVDNTVLSLAHRWDRKLNIKNYELLKGIKGIQSHEEYVEVPIFSNSQDMEELSKTIRAYRASKPNMQGFLLAGHGLYTWGTTIAEAKRHVETFEFLFSCIIKLRIYGYD